MALTESSDFETWTPADTVFHVSPDDPPGTEIYSMAVMPYEGIYIGLVQAFYGNPAESTLDIQLAMSRDGKNFARVRKQKTVYSPGGDRRMG